MSWQSFWKKEKTLNRAGLVTYFFVLLLASGVLGGLFSSFIVPRMDNIPILNLLSGQVPFVVNKTEQVIINDGVNLRDSYDRLRAVTVTIASFSGQQDFSVFKSAEPSLGSGLIATSDGYILTTKSVVVSEKNRLRVFLPDNTSYEAKFAAVDTQSELALIKIDKENLPVPQFALQDELAAGDKLVSVGPGFGSVEPPLAQSSLSGLSGSAYPYPNFHSSDVSSDTLSLNPSLPPDFEGASLINHDSHIVGMQTKAGVISGDYLRSAVNYYLANRRLDRPNLGFNYSIIAPAQAKILGLPEKYGVVIVSRPGFPAIKPGSPAYAAGLKEGDFIYRVDGKDLGGKNTLSKSLNSKNAGEDLEFVLWRPDGEKRVKVTYKF